jgi:hypothetical protein
MKVLLVNDETIVLDLVTGVTVDSHRGSTSPIMAELPEWSVTVRFIGDGIKQWHFPAVRTGTPAVDAPSAMKTWEAAERRARALRDEIVGALEEIDGPTVVRAVIS